MASWTGVFPFWQHHAAHIGRLGGFQQLHQLFYIIFGIDTVGIHPDNNIPTGL